MACASCNYGDRFTHASTVIRRRLGQVPRDIFTGVLAVLQMALRALQETVEHSTRQCPTSEPTSEHQPASGRRRRRRRRHSPSARPSTKGPRRPTLQHCCLEASEAIYLTTKNIARASLRARMTGAELLALLQLASPSFIASDPRKRPSSDHVQIVLHAGAAALHLSSGSKFFRAESR
jgi:hypothetical protein